MHGLPTPHHQLFSKARKSHQALGLFWYGFQSKKSSSSARLIAVRRTPSQHKTGPARNACCVGMGLERLGEVWRGLDRAVPHQCTALYKAFLDSPSLPNPIPTQHAFRAGAVLCWDGVLRTAIRRALYELFLLWKPYQNKPSAW